MGKVAKGNHNKNSAKPRKKRGHHCQWTEATMKLALDAVRDHSMSQRKTCKTFSIPTIPKMYSPGATCWKDCRRVKTRPSNIDVIFFHTFNICHILWHSSKPEPVMELSPVTCIFVFCCVKYIM